MISQVFRCAWTTRGDFGAWKGSGAKGKYVPGPERRIGPDRRRPPRKSKRQLHTEHTSGVHQPWTQHPVGRPCRPGTRLNPAMEHTDSIEQGGNYREQGRLISLLRDLTESDRALLEWRMVDGWDYAAIARRLGIPRADLAQLPHF